MKTHYLKCWPAYFGLVLLGAKPFELRKNDRNYQVGDVLVLEEFDPEMFEKAFDEFQLVEVDMDAARYRAEEVACSGRTLRRVISCIVADGPWLTPGYVALGLREE